MRPRHHSHGLASSLLALAPLTDYEQTTVRIESRQAALEISTAVKARCRRLGHEPIAVPAASVQDRVQFILSRVHQADS